MPDNLAISITAETTKARAEIDLLKSKLRELRAEAAKLADAERRGGGDPARRLATVRTIQVTEQEIKKLTVSTRIMTKANEEAESSFRHLALEIGHLAHEAGISIEGLKALRGGMLALAGVEVVRAFTDITDKIEKLANLSKETRIDPRAIQVWRKAIEEIGGSADKADEALRGLSDTVREAQKAALEGGQALSGPTVLRGVKDLANPIVLRGLKETGSTITNVGDSSTEVFHGANRNLVQFSDNLRALHIDVKQLTFTKEGLLDERSVLNIAKALVELHRAGKVDEANLRSLAILNQTYNEIGKTLEKLVGDYERVSGRTKFVTPEEFEANERYKASLNELNDAFNDLKKTLAVFVFPEITAFFHDLTQGMKDSEEQIRTLIGWVDGLWQKLKGLGSAIGTAVSNVGATGVTPTPMMAAGGYVQGPGSGTSDSIPARLSNGEFVINAASVRALGVGFLQGLNGFAAGGLIGAAPMRYAEGGLVSASGGTPVHVHFGGEVFGPFHGDDAVVGSLVRASSRYQMRSAGTKPSWYGGRPGG